MPLHHPGLCMPPGGAGRQCRVGANASGVRCVCPPPPPGVVCATWLCVTAGCGYTPPSSCPDTGHVLVQKCGNTGSPCLDKPMLGWAEGGGVQKRGGGYGGGATSCRLSRLSAVCGCASRVEETAGGLGPRPSRTCPDGWMPPAKPHRPSRFPAPWRPQTDGRVDEHTRSDP